MRTSPMSVSASADAERNDHGGIGELPSIPEVPTYEQFIETARRASQEIVGESAWRQRVVPIPLLRRVLRHVPVSVFDRHLLRMERNDVVYLIPPETTSDELKDDDRHCTLRHPSGGIRSSLLWITSRDHPIRPWGCYE